jgi:hypothetical protein
MICRRTSQFPAVLDGGGRCSHGGMVHASLRTAFQALEMGAQRTTRAARCGPRLRRLRPPSYPRVWRESRFEYRRRRILGARLAVRLMTLPLEAAVSAGDRWRGRVVLLDHSALDDDRPSDLLDLRNRISAKLARRTNAPPDPMLPLDAYLGMAKRMPHTATNDAQQPSDEVRRQATELLKQRWSQRNRGGSTP